MPGGALKKLRKKFIPCIMACAERWLFRMWHLYLFLITLLITDQTTAAAIQNSSREVINNGTNQTHTDLNNDSKTAESQPAFAPADVKSGILQQNGSNPLNNIEKPSTENTTKPPQKTLTNHTQTKVVEDVQNMPSTSISSINETAKIASSLNDSKTLIPEIKGPKLPQSPPSTIHVPKPPLPAKTTENKSEPGKKPPVSSSDKPTPSEHEQEVISKPKGPQVPLPSIPKDVDSQNADDNQFDLNNKQIPDGDFTGYDGVNDGDEMESPQKNDEPDMDAPAEDKTAEKSETTKGETKPQIKHPKQTIGSDDFDNGDSHFFIYFLTVVGMCIVMYVLFHNKQKILALIVEGRQERRRRPNTNQYRPLDNNLEEVIQAGAPKNGRLTTNIIY